MKGSDYTEIYLLGDKGPIKRSKIEADILKK